MTYLENKLDARLGRPSCGLAMLALEDGTVLEGRAVGAAGEVFGEICFNTSMTGYVEVLTDPSYAGQIVVMSYPQIGNYGVCLADIQAAHPALRGFVMHELCAAPSNWRSDMSLREYLQREGVVAIDGVDTRELIEHIRTRGAMKACISTVDASPESLLAKVAAAPALGEENFVAQVSCAQVLYPEDEQAATSSAPAEGDTLSGEFPAAAGQHVPEDGGNRRTFRVVALHCGMKQAILDDLRSAGCEVTVVPWDTSASAILALQPDGVFLSNGPGDPDKLDTVAAQVHAMLGKVPIFGICLGHQLLCKAAGARIVKLPFGHHGANQPVRDNTTGIVEVTAQNHGYNVDFASLGEVVPSPDGPFAACPVVNNPQFGRVALTHVNLNDGTAEGVTFLDVPAFSVQYHPEAAPGPTDARYLFDRFARLMREGGGANA